MGRVRLSVLLAIVTAFGVAGPIRAEIYRWTDSQGRVHFSEDLSRVPAGQRAAAKDAAAAERPPSRLQSYQAVPTTQAPRSPSIDRWTGAGRAHRIRVERAGNGMIVPVRINGQTVAPFLIDTGASYVLIPRRVATDAGVTIGPDTRKMRFQTANGIVEQEVVTLESVELGSARVAQVAATISDGMEVGLLGLSFFNRFTYQIDAAAGIVTLRENGLEASGHVVGGRSRAQWRGEFETLRGQIAELEQQRDAVPASRSRHHDRLDAAEEQLARQLDELEAEADQAQVPQSWRR
jgi:clan AA aspartic protease (TIGR02281 family)